MYVHKIGKQNKTLRMCLPAQLCRQMDIRMGTHVAIVPMGNKSFKVTVLGTQLPLPTEEDAQE